MLNKQKRIIRESVLNRVSFWCIN